MRSELKINEVYSTKKIKKYKTQQKNKKIDKNPNKKTRYRGKGKDKRKRSQTFSILLMNLRGLKGKKSSLEKVIKRLKPSMIALNETQLQGNAKVQLPSYISWTRNRKEQVGGGVASCISKEFKDSAVGVGEGVGDDEFLITRIESFSPALSVVNCYGEQRKTTKEEVKAKWTRLRKELDDIRIRKDFCVLTGDLNKLVGCDEWGVQGNKPELSLGGKLLRELLATKDWLLVNGLGKEVVQGGPFTRIDPATGRLSCLDLFIITRQLRPYVESLMIDSGRKLKVARPVGKRGKLKPVYSDHYPVLLTLTNLPRAKEEKKEKVVRWNLAKEGGWEKYMGLGERCGEDFKIEHLSIQEAQAKFQKQHNKMKYKSFGKVSLSNKRKQVEINDTNSVKTDDETAKLLRKEQVKRTEEELEQIRISGKGKVGQIWEIKKRVIGGKKASLESTAIINPNTGKLAVSRKAIKEISLQYCVETLSNNEPEHDFEKIIKSKKTFVKCFLKLKGGNFGTSKETFDMVIQKFKKSRKKTYDYLTKSGTGFKDVVFKFFQRMFEEEQFPMEFQRTTLHMIFKGGRGRREILSDNRFIHSKEWAARTAEALVVEDGLRDPLVKGSSRYQIGGQAGHRSEELVFVIKSGMAKYKMFKKLLAVNFFYISKFFTRKGWMVQ